MILCPDEDGDEDVGAVLILPSSFSVLLMASRKAQNLVKHLFSAQNLGESTGTNGSAARGFQWIAKQKERNNHRKKQAKQQWMDIPLTKLNS